MNKQLSFSHFLFALAVVAIWGTNFVIIKQVLAILPPFFFAALRFFFAFFPACLFFSRPRIAWRYMATFGILIGCGQFGFLFWAMKDWITPGIASLVVQTQVLFTIVLAKLLEKEQVLAYQVVSSLIAIAGMGIIFAHSDGHVTPLGLALVLMAALSWAMGNMVNRAAASAAARSGEKFNALAFVVWSSIYAVPFLLLASYLFEGTEAMGQSLQSSTPYTWFGLFWQSYANSIFGYGVWGWLLVRYTATTITPMALLVPVFGMGASYLVLAESMPGWKWFAAALILTGLAINFLWPKWRLATTA